MLLTLKIHNGQLTHPAGGNKHHVAALLFGAGLQRVFGLTARKVMHKLAGTRIDIEPDQSAMSLCSLMHRRMSGWGMTLMQLPASQMVSQASVEEAPAW